MRLYFFFIDGGLNIAGNGVVGVGKGAAKNFEKPLQIDTVIDSWKSSTSEWGWVGNYLDKITYYWILEWSESNNNQLLFSALSIW